MASSNEPRWPPRSPHEALLSSPGGRVKVRQLQDRTSPSPSPLKKSRTAPDLRLLRRDSFSREDEEDDEDDEETLRLKLQAIEAQLKLKKLRQKKEKGAITSFENDSQGRHGAGSARKENVPPSSQRNLGEDVSASSEHRGSRDVLVQASPLKRKANLPQEQRSPGRVLLGIDKGLKGKNVSLRRPTIEQSKDGDPFLSEAVRSGSSREVGDPGKPTSQYSRVAGRPKSFSERMAETRKQDKAQKERVFRLHQERSSGFGVPQKDIESHRNAADKREANAGTHGSLEGQSSREEFSRDQILQASSKRNGGVIRRSNTSASIHRGERDSSPKTVWRNPNAEPELAQSKRGAPKALKRTTRSQSPQPQTAESTPQAAGPVADSLFEPFSSLHLSKRLLPHDLLTRTFSQKSLLLLPDLLGHVKSPDYCLPENLEADYVVLAIIATKSSPLSRKDAHRKTTDSEATSITEAAESEQNAKGKYMVLTLTDLKWTVDLFLFTTAYTRFRKLTPGTVAALLNPSIMPPLPGKADTGRFSLTLNSSADTVLEIGTSRDLGWCKSVRKDGKNCPDWIDKRHTEFCEFHVDRVIEKTRRGRMEVQGMSAPFAPGGRKSGRTGHFSGGGGSGGGKRRDARPWGDQSRDDGFAREGAQHDRGSGSRYFVAPNLAGGRSAVQLFDAEGALERGGSKEDRVRKRLAERERENEIARKLGEGGNGAGSEYLRSRNGGGHGGGREDGEDGQAEVVDAVSLGLMGNQARDVHLSPIKKRKAGGGALEGVSARKKTSFVTEKGIREAGRESLGGPECKGLGEDDDDGDLEIC